MKSTITTDVKIAKVILKNSGFKWLVNLGLSATQSRYSQKKINKTPEEKGFD